MATSLPSTSQTRLEDFLSPSRSVTSGETEQQDVRLASHAQRVYVLCGVVGSGKSTFSSQFEALYPNDYVRVNQDALGSRKKCEDLTKLALSKGKSVLVDRQNYDASQRYTWIKLAHEHAVEVAALVFQTSKKTCADRLKLRRFHETVKSPEQGLQILNSISAIFTPPVLTEGFHRIVNLKPDLPLRFRLSDINAILESVDAAEKVDAVLPSTPPEPTPRNTFSPSATRGGGAASGRFQRAGSARGRGGGGRGGTLLQFPSHGIQNWLTSPARGQTVERRFGNTPPSSSGVTTQVGPLRNQRDAEASNGRVSSRMAPYPSPPTNNTPAGAPAAPGRAVMLPQSTPATATQASVIDLDP